MHITSISHAMLEFTRVHVNNQKSSYGVKSGVNPALSRNGYSSFLKKSPILQV